MQIPVWCRAVALSPWMGQTVAKTAGLTINIASAFAVTARQRTSKTSASAAPWT